MSTVAALLQLPLVVCLLSIACTAQQSREVNILQGSTINVQNIYLNYDPSAALLVLQLINDTWIDSLTAEDVIMTGTYSDYLQPHGFNAAMSYTDFSVSASQSILNITFGNNQCYFPSVDEVITVSFANDSTVSGSYVEPTSFTMAGQTAQMSSDSISGLIIVSVAMSALAFLFLLDSWCDVLVALSQLQTMMMLALSTCAPPGLRAIVAASQWVLWPIADRISNTTTPHAGSHLEFFFAFILAAAFLSLGALVLFAFFGTSRNRAGERARFPGAFLIVFLGLLPGGVFASTLALVPLATGQPVVNTSITGVGILGCIVCGVVGFAIIFAVFRVVASLEYRDSASMYVGSVWRRLFFGGQWVNRDGVIERWGVLFENLSGSGFWFFAVHIVIVGIIAALTAFTPANTSNCNRQYSGVTALLGVSTVLIFLRRPFKSVFLNLTNMAVSVVSTVISIAFMTAMTCSTQGMAFSYIAMWFGITIIMFKALATLVLAAAKQFVEFYRDTQNIRRQRNGTTPRRRRFDAESDAIDLQPFNVSAENRRGIVDAVTYTPAIPVPYSVGACVVCREVGFGPKGGLEGTSGPSIGLQLNQPTGLCIVGSYVYVLDTGNHRILRHDTHSRAAVTFAGAYGEPGYSGDGSSSGVRLDSPRALCAGQACLYVADTNNDCVRRIDLYSRHIITILGAGFGATTLIRPHGVAVMGNVLYVSDTLQHRVLAVQLSTSMHVTTVRHVMGTRTAGFDPIHTPAVASRLTTPQALAACEDTGDLYIVDTGNHRVLRYSTVTQAVAVVLGIAGVAGESHTNASGSVLGTTVMLCLPTDVCVVGPSTNRQVFVVDGGNCKIWRVNRLGYACVILPPSDSLTPQALTAWSSQRQLTAGAEDGNDVSAAFTTPLLLGRSATTASAGSSLLHEEEEDSLLLFTSDPLNNLVASLRVSYKPSVMHIATQRLTQMKNPFETEPRIGADDDGL